ncbi:MAG TPA: YfhO family protein [Thermoanaerobaculia bacterium]|nr:YfhO family protein [Thermoanaerobaculia bacterium]
MTPERSHRLLALAIVALVPTILFGDVVFGFASLYTRDVSLYHYPHQQMLRNIVLSGEFPYWNPYISAGQPAAANPAYQVFYPLTWLILLPDYHTGFHLMAILHLYIASFAMYALLRSMDLGRPAACFGAVSFGVGGLMVALLNLFPFLFSIAWFPLTCLYARRFLLRRAPRDFALASFFLGIQLVIGEPVTAFQAGLLLGFYALYRASRDGGWRTAPKHLGAIALISLVALLVSAVQTVPAFDHVGDSIRGRGMDFIQVRSFSTPPLRFAEVIFPNILGRMDVEGTPVFWASRLYPLRNTAFFFSIYSGLAAAVLALAGVLARMRGAGLVAVIAALAALVSAGDNTPLLQLLYESGAGSLARFPEKFLIMGVFTLVVFGSQALDRLLAGDERLRKVALRITLAVIAAAFLAAAVSAMQSAQPLFRQIFGIAPGRPIAAMTALYRREFVIAGLRALFLFLLFRNVLDPRRTAWLALFGAFVLFDLAAQAPQIAPRTSPSYYEEPPTVRRFAPDRDDYRIMNLADWDKRNAVAQRYFGVDAVYWWAIRNTLPPMTPGNWRLRTVVDSDFDMTDLQAEHDFSAAVSALSKNGPNDWLETIATMSNVRYIGVYRKREEALAMAGGWNRNIEPVQFLAGRDHPRYYFASELVTIRDKDDFVAAIRRGGLTRNAAFIHEPAFRPAPGVVRARKEWFNGARLEVEATGRAFLVMSVTPHKYWRITVDGIERPSRVTNIGYQGVEIPPGHHTLEMHYRNPLIPACAAISLVTLLGLGWVVARGGRHGAEPVGFIGNAVSATTAPSGRLHR